MECLLEFDSSELDSYEDVSGRKVTENRQPFNISTEDPNVECTGNPLKCPLCDFVGRNVQKTRTHFKVHDSDMIVKTVIINQRPVCEQNCCRCALCQATL